MYFSRNIRFKYEDDVGIAQLEQLIVLRNKSISSSHKRVRHNVLRHICINMYLKARATSQHTLVRGNNMCNNELSLLFLCITLFPGELNSAAHKIVTIFMSIIRGISIVYTLKLLTFMSISLACLYISFYLMLMFLVQIDWYNEIFLHKIYSTLN